MLMVDSSGFAQTGVGFGGRASRPERTPPGSRCRRAARSPRSRAARLRVWGDSRYEEEQIPTVWTLTSRLRAR
jgi:hypothetical protein